MTAAEEQHLLRVVRGDPTAAELAALVAVLAAASGAGAEPVRRPPAVWAAPARSHRPPLHVGPGGWRASGLPR